MVLREVIHRLVVLCYDLGKSAALYLYEYG